MCLLLQLLFTKCVILYGNCTTTNTTISYTIESGQSSGDTSLKRQNGGGREKVISNLQLGTDFGGASACVSARTGSFTTIPSYVSRQEQHWCVNKRAVASER
jgi:hypothetical protein